MSMLENLKRLEQIANKHCKFFCCNSIEEFCEIYNIDYYLLYELSKKKLRHYKFLQKTFYWDTIENF